MPSLTPLQLFDLKNLGVPPPGEEQPRRPTEEDPLLDVILASPRISPQAKAYLRVQERQRRRRRELELELQRLEAEKGPEGVISWIGPVPIGFQFGTAAGIEDPITRFLVDVVADPINLLGVGTLTKVGRAAKFLKGVSAERKAELILDAVKASALAQTDDIFARSLIEATERAGKLGGTGEELFNLVKQAGKTKFGDDVLESLAKTGDEGADLVRAIRNEGGMRRALRDAFDLADKRRPLAQAQGFMQQVKTGQRAILSLGIPGLTHDVELFALRNLADDLGIRRFVSEAGFRTTERSLRMAEDLRPSFTAVTKAEGTVLEGAPQVALRRISERRFWQIDEDIRRLPGEIKGETEFVEKATTEVAKRTSDVIEGIAKQVDATPRQVRDVLNAAVKQLDSPRGMKTREVLETLRRAQGAVARPSAVKTLAQLFRETLAPNQLARLEGILAEPAGREILEQYAALRATESILGDISLLLEGSKAGANRLVGFLDDLHALETTSHKLGINETRQAAAREALKGEGLLATRTPRRRPKHPFMEDFRPPIEPAVAKELGVPVPPPSRVAVSAERKAARFEEGVGETLAKGAKRLERTYRRQLERLLDDIGISGRERGQISERLFRRRTDTEFVGNTIRSLLKRESQTAIREAKRSGILKPRRELSPRRLREAEDIAQASQNVPPAGGVASPVSSRIEQSAAAAKVVGQSAADLHSIARSGDEVIDTFRMLDDMGADAREVSEAASSFHTGVHGQARVLEEKIRHFAADDDALLQRIALDIDEPGKAHLAGAGDEAIVLRDTLATIWETLGRKLRDDNFLPVFLNDYFPRILRSKTERGAALMSQFAKQSRDTLTKGARTKDRAILLLRQTKAFVAKHADDIEWRRDAQGRSALRADVAMRMYLGQVGDSYMRWRTVEQHLATLPADAGGVPYAIIGNARSTDEMIARGFSPEQAELIKARYVQVDHPLDAMRNIYFHPEIQKFFKPLFDKDYFIDPIRDPARTNKEKFLRGLDWLSQFGKASLFRFSLFHGSSILQSLLPGFTIFDPAAAGKLSFKEFGRTAGTAAKVTIGSITLPHTAGTVMLKNLHRIATGSPGFGVTFRDSEELIARFLRSNPIGRPEFQAFDHFGEMLRRLAKSENPFIRAAGVPLDRLNDFFDRNLWDVWHTSSRFLYWTHQRAAHIAADASLLANPKKLLQVEREIGRFGGEMLGGLAWDRLGMNPSIRRYLSFAFIAADWTLSNLLIARDLILTAPGIRNLRLAGALTPDIVLHDVRGKLARQYALRATVYAGLFGNVLNFMFTGKTLFEADEDAIDESGIPRIELPWRRFDGRKQYMDFSKQFAEPLEWIRPIVTGNFQDLQSFLFPKLGTLPRTFGSLVIGYNPGLNTATFHESDGPIAQWMQVGEAAVKPFIPIPFNEASRVLRGQRDWRSAVVANVGFSVRTESKNAAKLREYEEAIQTAVETGRTEGIRLRPVQTREPTAEERRVQVMSELQTLGGAR